MADVEPPTPPHPDDPEQSEPAPSPQRDPYHGYAPPPALAPPGPYADPRAFAAQHPGGAAPAEQAPFGQGPDVPGPTQRRQPAASSRRTVLVAAVLAALIGGGVGAGTVALVDRNDNDTVTSGLAVTSQAAPAVKLDGSVTAAAAKISPSVVTINVTSQQEQDTGSGVIIRSDGYILTNNHVITTAANGAGTISVTLNDGKIAAGKIVGQDPSDDLAVVKVSASGLTAATFATSGSLQVGQTVVAVGAPLGLSDTVTSGIVSNAARPVQTGDSSSNLAVFDAIQTDAAINPGNSGGPLVNLNGDVVGINAAIASDQSSGGLQVPGQQGQAGNIGIGFAIPSDEADRIAGELITTGKATHAIIGASVEDTASQTSTGARVRSVTPGGPAAKAGIKAGDVVTQVGDQRVAAADDLVAAIRSHAPSQQVQITYQRSGTSHTVAVRLGAAAS